MPTVKEKLQELIGKLNVIETEEVSKLVETQDKLARMLKAAKEAKTPKA